MEKGLTFPVNEIFYSIQGEGFHTGTPAVFIRLAGCNLNCPWCDTEHHKSTNMSLEDILSTITNLLKEVDVLSKNLPLKPVVVITGGEPTIHPTLYGLVYFLENHFKIHLETNGTNPKQLEKLSKILNWIAISPKKIGEEKYKKEMQESCASFADEVKIVLDGEINPFDYIKTTSGKIVQYYIQPLSENYQPAIDFVKKYPIWKLSVQMQKVIKVR